MNIQQQIADFEAKGCVAGGFEWIIQDNWDRNLAIQNGSIFFETVFLDNTVKLETRKINVQYSKNKDCFVMYSMCSQDLTSTTLEEALIEALEIVKAKVIDLAKELGFVCIDKEQLEMLMKLLNYTEVITAHTQKSKELPEPTGIYAMIEQLQQYIEENSL